MKRVQSKKHELGTHEIDHKRYALDDGFILWAFFTKIVSQVVIIKNIVIIEKDHDNWKRLWLLKKIVIIKKDYGNWKN